MLSYNVPEANDGTAFAAHVGGTLAGLALMGGWKLVQRIRPGGKDTADILESMDAQLVASEPATIFLSQDGNQLGPFTSAQVKEMRSLGSVRDDAYFWEDGMADWQPIVDLQR